MDLILIRHGQSQFNFDQTGGEDAPLTAAGREQARRAGIYCRTQFRLVALYASTYRRAQETAEIMNRFVALPQITLLDDLREFVADYGPNMPQYDSPIAALHVEQRISPACISDYYVAFQARVQRAVEQILNAHRDRWDTDAQIAIVSHGGVMGTILRTVAGTHHFSSNTENTGIHILRWHAKRWHWQATNRVEHLECDRWQHEPGKDA